MAVASAPYRWSLEAFLRAFEAGAFECRVELVDGEVLTVAIGRWHGDTSLRLARVLPNDRFVVSAASLPSAGSLPDPDCWVRPAAAEPAEQLSSRVVSWSPADVVLVVEVSDETVEFDLGPKAMLYGRAGFPCYWVVTREGIFEHTGPHDDGYRTRTRYRAHERIAIAYAGVDLAVSDVLAAG